MMLQQYLNWRTLFAVIAIGIVTGTIVYSNYLSDKIAADERLKVEAWVEASKFLINAAPDTDIQLPSLIRNEQKNIPIIETDEKDSVISFVNIDSNKVFNNPYYLAKKLKEFKKSNPPIVLQLSKDPVMINKYYYGESLLLQEVRYYPLVQLIVVALFIILAIVSIQLRNRSTQNQVWVGMAKETAHQLGTPVSSLRGWVEMLREMQTDEKIVAEIEKDVERLSLVSDRFGKIGSTPQLSENNLTLHVEKMVEYMKRRAAGSVVFEIQRHQELPIMTAFSPQLFDWVIENLLKNALDSMKGKGTITVELSEDTGHILIDVTDTGKGIPRSNWERVFKPGFSTKKRGWGLGLSLSKRIIEQYHQGELYVKYSEPGKGTTFRIRLNKTS